MDGARRTTVTNVTHVTQNKNLQHSNSTMATFLRYYPSAWLILSIAATLTSFVSAWSSSASNRLSRYDCCTHSATTTNTIHFLSSTPDNNDNDDGNWGFEDNNINDREEEDPRLTSMRAMLESSWDEKIMGIIPSGPEQAAAAAADAVASAMAENHNVVLIDLRLPSYDISEGPKFYDIMAASDFCSFLSDRLRDRNLIRKSLVLCRNEKERLEIERVRSQRDDQGEAIQDVIDDRDDDSSADNDLWEETGNEEIDDFRAKLMDSWDAPVVDADKTKDSASASKPQSSAPKVMSKRVSGKTQSSHRLWSMIGNVEITSNGPDMFDQVVAAVDENAILSTTTSEPEDALIILSPYDTTDVIAMRRTLARYGQTRTIIIVNHRMEKLPTELHSAQLVYGILPLIARPRSKQDGNDSGLKAVVMKRFPSEWSLYVDVYGDGFVEANKLAGSDKEFPSPDSIAIAVQKHIEGLK